MSNRIFAMIILTGLAFSSNAYNQENIYSNDCPPVFIVPSHQVEVYQRPGYEAELFGFLNSNDTIQGLARSASGWIGFDPGVAQAANLGVFRLRWIDLDSSIEIITGNFKDLPVIWTPEPGKCYNMFLNISYLYSYPDVDSEIIDSFNPGDIAEIVKIDSSGWGLIVSISEDTVNSCSGWIKPEDLNINGSGENN